MHGVKSAKYQQKVKFKKTYRLGHGYSMVEQYLVCTRPWAKSSVLPMAVQCDPIATFAHLEYRLY